MKEEIKIVALSDTHGQHREVDVPMGDVLIHAGDFMTCGRRFAEVQSFGKWFSEQPHKYKILVAGNHDRLMESKLQLCLNEFKGVTYLQDSGCEIKGWKFYGSPWQPWFYDWAFNVHRGQAIKKYWDKIPLDTDVLITHGPPYGILDQSIPEERISSWSSTFVIPPSENVGCEDLLSAVNRVEPKFHFFGHIHGSYGKTIRQGDRNLMHFHNVAICDEQYNAANDPHVVTLERE